MPDVRVRFAPSPTGYLHLGGARTALFNWLWARKQGGTFILRVEDTDRERSTGQSVRILLDSLRWLGLDWDEGPETGGPSGPYFQTGRLELYRQYADRLVDAGRAYRCYCTREELAEARRKHAESGCREAFRYPGTCRDRTDAPDLPHVVRFKAPSTGATVWEDRVKGRIEVRHDTLQDFVILRANGIPLYNLGAAVDDLTMGVTLVARGDDHMINTAPQVLICRALGHEPPEFAHLPMILAPNGEKLSKRHAAVAVLDYREQGYLPDAVLNYLARLGWSHGDQEIFSRRELVEKFDWKQVGSTAGKYDVKKFLHVQASHLRMLPGEVIAAETAPLLAARSLPVAPDDERLRLAVETVRPRASTFVEAAEMMDFYFREPPELDPKLLDKFLKPEIAPVLAELARMLSELDRFDRVALEERVKAWLEEKEIKLKTVAQPARVSLTGRKASPGLFEVMEVLGRDTTLKRLEHGAAHARGER
jgi:glutamyl-tRNA synthetase